MALDSFSNHEEIRLCPGKMQRPRILDRIQTMEEFEPPRRLATDLLPIGRREMLVVDLVLPAATPMPSYRVEGTYRRVALMDDAGLT